MYYEFLNAPFLMHYPNEFNNFLPLVSVVHAQSALDCDWNANLLAHLSTNFCNLMRLEHEDSSKCPISGLLTGTAAVNIYFVIAPLLHNFCCLSHFYGIVASQLKDNRVLIWSVGQQSFA